MPHDVKTATGDAPPDVKKRSLSAMFFPRSIALMGATPNKETFAGRLLANLRSNGYRGKLFLVNPKYSEIDGLACHPSIAALPGGEVPDAAMILTEGGAALRLLQDCETAGVAAATIFAAGFGEAQAGGEDRVAEIKRITDRGRIRLCGPNTIGLANYHTGAIMLAAGNIPPSLKPGSLGVVSQSGGVGYTVLNKAYARHLPTGLMVVTGNAIDVDIAEYVTYFAQLDEISTIAVYFEAVPRIRPLAEAFGEAVRRGKTVVAYRAGRSEAGSRMAASHTGVLTQGAAVIDELLASTGAIMHASLEDMFETAYAAVTVGRPSGRGVAITSVSGGCNVQAADKAIEYGLDVAPIGEATVKLLQNRYPFATAQNPYDPTGLWRRAQHHLHDCIAALADDPAIATAVYVAASNHAAYSAGMVDSIIAASKIARKPVVAAYLTAGKLTLPFEDHLKSNGVPVFESLDGCMGALGRLAATGSRPPWEPAPRRPEALPHDRLDRFQAICQTTRPGPQNEHLSKRLLAAYGIDVVEEVLAGSPAEAIAAAARLGYPVVMKKVAEGLIHKTEVGGVRLNIGDADAVRACFGDFTRDGSTTVLIQPQVQNGVEMIVGGRRDAQLGPIVMLGAGGILTELMGEVVCRMAPVTARDAQAMLAGLRAARLLGGFRGGAALAAPRLLETVVGLSWMLAENPDITEVDINPVVVTKTRAVAVDASIIFGP
ncbi:MAG: acetate--CoA ligase family protein [Alphaproteobacteria bacterium]